jgi:hypothetical protein
MNAHDAPALPEHEEGRMGLQTYRELSDEELERIERRSEAATDGPWLSYLAGRDDDAPVNYIELGECNELGCCKTIELSGATQADQDFIAHAREDLPRLVQELRLLRAQLQALNASSGDLSRSRHESAVALSPVTLGELHSRSPRSAQPLGR